MTSDYITPGIRVGPTPQERLSLLEMKVIDLEAQVGALYQIINNVVNRFTPERMVIVKEKVE
jgi:hypothetical protein